MAANSCRAVSTLQIARAKLNKANGSGVEMSFFLFSFFLSSKLKGLPPCEHPCVEISRRRRTRLPEMKLRSSVTRRGIDSRLRGWKSFGRHRKNHPVNQFSRMKNSRPVPDRDEAITYLETSSANFDRGTQMSRLIINSDNGYFCRNPVEYGSFDLQ